MYIAGITLIVLGLGGIGYAWLDYNQTKVSPKPLVFIGLAIAVAGAIAFSVALMAR